MTKRELKYHRRSKIRYGFKSYVYDGTDKSRFEMDEVGQYDNSRPFKNFAMMIPQQAYTPLNKK